MKQNQSTILHRAAMMLAAVMLTAVTAWAQTYTVTLTAGEGSGSDMTLNTTNDYFGTVLNTGDVPKGKFYTMNGQLYFRCPDCPFSAPSEKVFTGWSTDGGPGQF